MDYAKCFLFERDMFLILIKVYLEVYTFNVSIVSPINVMDFLLSFNIFLENLIKIQIILNIVCTCIYINGEDKVNELIVI